MVNYLAIIIGTIIYILFVLAGSASGLCGIVLGIFISGCTIGYLVGKQGVKGLIHGWIIGMIGMVCLMIIQWPNIAITLNFSHQPVFIKWICISVLLTGIGGLTGSITRRILENHGPQ